MSHTPEAGTAVTEICRKLGLSQQTFYTWRRKLAGMGVADLRKLEPGLFKRVQALL